VAVQLPANGVAVGRQWLADAGLPDSKVSSNHLRFRRESGQLFVEDLDSSNCTWVNGGRLAPYAPALLVDGAILRVGGSLLVYRADFDGPLLPQPLLGGLAGPWTLGPVRARLAALRARPVHSVLLLGETGTGKELLAREVARVLGRPERLFVPVNITGIPREMFEGHLFGSERGAFSGSIHANPGVIRQHDHGAVFLDEIGDLAPELQPKLLRFLENREVHAVGATRPVQVDVSLIAATNRGLDEMVKHDTFRRDLLARFPVRIALPPLRSRAEDLFAVLATLWPRDLPPLGATPIQIEAAELLLMQAWPNNVRDLVAVIANLDLTVPLKRSALLGILGVEASAVASTPHVDFESIDRALAFCGGNKTQAAKRLGISRNALIRRLEKRDQAQAGPATPRQKS
jgi:transcriptional regulator with PAS, ATPase and Fis domain